MADSDTSTNESMGMDHETAIQSNAATRYLTGDLTAEQAEAFEEHYFSCEECAKEVRDGELFAASLRDVLSEEQHKSTAPENEGVNNRPIPFVAPAARGANRRQYLTGGLAIAASLFAAAFLYDRAVVFPRMNSEIADLSRPQQPSRVTLKRSRGSAAPEQLSTRSRFWLVEFQLQNPNQYPSYICEIETPAGKRLADVTLDPPPPGRPFNIQLKRSEFSSGNYIFRVRGRNETAPIVTYTIDLTSE